MTQLAIAPQSMPVLNPAQAAAPGETSAAATDGQAAPDFAAVLQAQIAQPAKDTAEAAILAAALPPGAADGDAGPAVEVPQAAMTELVAGLLPDMAVLAPALATALAPAAAVASAPAALQPADTPVVQTPLATAPGLDAGQTQTRNTAVALPDRIAATAGVAAPQPGQAGTPAASAQAAATPAAPQATAMAELPAATLSVEAKLPAPAIEAAATPAPTSAATPAPTPAAAPAPTPAAAPHVPAAPAGEAPALSRIDTPVGARGWDAEVGQKVVWMVNRMESRAELSLTPPQLGRVEVTITVSGEQTSATFVAASPAAREALEQALPRLREILAEAGISLGQASVNAESARDGREETPAQAAAGRGEAQAERTTTTVTPWTRTGNGLIDTFA
jgi:flagellar hook-length control protein FliK